MTDDQVVEIIDANDEKILRKLLDSSYEGVKILFIFAYDNTAGNNEVSVDSFKNHFLLRVTIKKYIIQIDVRNFYDQPLNYLIKQKDGVRKASARQTDYYTTGC